MILHFDSKYILHIVMDGRKAITHTAFGVIPNAKHDEVSPVSDDIIIHHAFCLRKISIHYQQLTYLIFSTPVYSILSLSIVLCFSSGISWHRFSSPQPPYNRTDPFCSFRYLLPFGEPLRDLQRDRSPPSTLHPENPSFGQWTASNRIL